MKRKGLYNPEFIRGNCGVGFVCNIKGTSSHTIIEKGIESLVRLLHRGATGADPQTGDGSGILIQIPDEFLRKECVNSKIDLPERGKYAVGMVFLPQRRSERILCEEIFAGMIKKEGLYFLGWRNVPVDSLVIGRQAKDTQPVIKQIFIQCPKEIKDELEFERRLYLLRKKIENSVRSSNLKQKSFFYISNLSCRTLSYKGLLMSTQLKEFFLDLKDEEMKSTFSLIHARYSTNTFPTWDLAQPFRYLAHNGEINTLRGNINWMKAREGNLKSRLLGKDLKEVFPIIVPGGSDSATIDNVFELLVLAGRPLYHAMMMLIPSAWEQDNLMEEGLKDFYKFGACFMEPWDGPAAIAFTDGIRIGAVLDRNGLRPARYIVTKDDFVVMASEVGVLDIAPENIALSGRLQPGKIFYVDTQEKRIVQDEEIKEIVSKSQPYSLWLKKNLVELDKLPQVQQRAKSKGQRENLEILTLLKVFGFTREDLKFIIKPMAEDGLEPTGSMGVDTPLAVLSKRPQLLYNYFKQLFAQVTNPAIDPIREELVMSLYSFVGSQKNILEETPQHCQKLFVKEPVLTNSDLERIRNIKGFKTKTISLLFKVSARTSGFIKRLKEIGKEAELAIKKGYSFIILSDRGVNEKYMSLPALLAVGAVHHHLVRKALRTQIGIILETAEPREVHHFALLFGYGGDCIYPYLTYEAVEYLVKKGDLKLDLKTALSNYHKAINKGILKILSKMGISTLQSYRGAQIFEALGLNEEVISLCFTGTVSRIGGADLKVIAQESLLRHKEAYPERKIEPSYLPTGGIYQWKRDGEFHLWNPESISALREAVRKNDYKKYKEFAKLINDQSENPTTLRGLFKFKKRKPVPIDEVEPVSEIVKRFATGAMSFGSISRAGHETIAIAMNRLGARSNCGEGGEDPLRFLSLSNGDSTCSKTKQVASGRFGVTTNYLVHSDELQIKIAQGAKPGEGGQLPGHKVSNAIAKTRYTTPGVTLISPPPHHDIYSIEDLAQLIFDLKNTNPSSRISVKLVSEIGVGTIAMGVAKGHSDMILISGGEGGTGASPLSSIRHAGLPWELGISETHQILVLNDLRSRVRLQTDGGMRTGRDVAIAVLLGAEEFGFCTSVLVTLGCVQCRHCHLNNCPVGIATQDEILERRFTGKVEHILNYFHFVAQELREIMASLGIRRVEEMIGRNELLEVDKEILPWKAEEIDFSKILDKPKVPKTVGVFCQIKQEHGIENVLDLKLIELSHSALERKEKVRIELPIKNTDRTTAAMLSGEVCKRYGEEGLPEDTLHFKFRGVAGQSFGAWLAKGITFELEGMANDYVGKGISGGKIIIYPDGDSDYISEENILIGNTTFYGAISGEAYIRGVAGERFCIRNSGLNTVVEGVGDHACEYMTGGRVIVLGKTGRNFAAGMSGGIAYVYDEDKEFSLYCNMSMVIFEEIKDEDDLLLSELLSKHYKYTKSLKAKKILDNFKDEIRNFVKVMPLEYKRILEGKRLEEKIELVEVSDG